MMNKNNEPLIDRLDPTLLNEQISNDQYFDEPIEFEALHSQNIIEKLIHLSRFGNLLTLVVGNNGCGKTYLLEKLLSSVDDTCQICHINAQPLLSIEQLFQQVIEAFAGETTFTGIPLTANQYEEWAEQLTTIPGNRLLIIDDAEVLSTSVLHELCQLSAMQQEKETPHLHLILLGNYDLNNILEQASHGVLNEEGIYAIDIPSLSDEQASDWLEYLFRKDGVVFLPEDDEFEKMVIEGQGNFSLLEELAREYSAITHDFNEFEAEDEPQKISGMGYWFGALSIFILLVLGLFFFQKELTNLLGLNSNDSVPIVTQQQTVIDATANNEDTKEVQVQSIEQEDEIEVEVVSDAPVEDIEQLIEETTVELLEQEPLEVIEDAADEALLEEQQVLETSEENTSEEEQPVVDKQDAIPEQVSSEININLTDAEQLILSYSDESYAIQVIGLRKERDIKSFVAQYKEPNMLYYKSTLSDKPWYIVILANYASKSAAAEARSNLPEDLRKHGPWIKSLKSIKSELTKAQQLFNQ